ncbi:VLRF1 family aeRF1-type release factor [Halalkalibacterium ligniniphilum]|uniref:VLRF1 family aeRF1-type release factor n=1 Tax=Halalkalibacterium ligniniphilum TaxID=1134413 RepID=UPI000349CDA0|nr:VLRF1 family aeRF1-type release factor [Halalkalibacterium ligniniphilum]
MKKLEPFRYLNGKRETEGPFLTIYLETDRSKQSQQRGEWKIRLKEGLKRLIEYRESEGDNDGKKALKKLAEKAERDIHQTQQEHKKGLVLVGSASNEVWEIVFLDLEVKNEFYWDEHPQLTQLESLQKSYPRSAIVLGSKDEVTIVDTAMGEVIETVKYSWDMTQDHWTEQKIPTPNGNQLRPSAYDSDHIDKKRKVLAMREYKKLVPDLQKSAKDCNWKGFYLVGDESVMEQLKEAFAPLKIIKTVPKNLNHKIHKEELLKNL